MKQYKITLTGDIFTMQSTFCTAQYARGGCDNCPLNSDHLRKLPEVMNSDREEFEGYVICSEFATFFEDKAAQIMNAELIEEDKNI